MLAAVFVGSHDARAGRLVAETDRDQPHAALRHFFGRLHGKAPLVFAVRDQYDILELPFLIVERLVHDLPQRVADHRAAARNAVHIHIVQHHPEETVIHRQRAFYDSCSGENHQPRAVAVHDVQAVFDGQFRAFQTARFQIVRQHAFRNVQNKHDIAATAAQIAPRRIPRRPRQTDDQKRQTKQRQRFLPTSRRPVHAFRHPRQQFWNHRQFAKQRPPPLAVHHENGQQERQQPQQMQHVNGLPNSVHHISPSPIIFLVYPFSPFIP